MDPKQDKKPRSRKKLANIVAAIVAVLFTVTVLVIVEARQTSFYGEPLLSKMAQVIDKKIHGLPKNAEAQARVVTGVSNLFLLPAEAVLSKELTARFKRTGTQFGYVTSDVSMGPKFTCRTSNIDQIPMIAYNIAAALQSLPEDLPSRLKMEYVVFCGDLVTPSGSVAGFPAPPDNVMFLNLTHRESDLEVRALFFHEFYHLFEDRLGLVHDAEWLKRFDAGYQNTYQGFMRPTNNEMGTGGFGFINNYSRSFPHEDRAEIFSALMVSRKKLASYIQYSQDDMLAAKTQYIAETMKKYLGVDPGQP